MSATTEFNVPLSNARSYANLARRDRTMGRLILLFVILIFAEGILRKWLVPGGLQRVLYFIREPAIFAIYFYYLRNYPINGRWVRPFLLYAFFVAALALLQNVYWQRSPLIPALGVRFYALYVPLAFIMADVMTKAHLRKVIVLLLWVSIPIAVLVFVQFTQPPTSWINKGTVEGGMVFTVTGGIVRPYGPFTFANGQTLYSGLMAAITMIAWERRRDLSLPFWLVLSAGFSTLSMMSVSGSRSAIGYVGLVMVFYTLAGFTSPVLAIGVRRTVTVVIAGILAASIFVLMFPAAFDAMSTRQTTALRHEGSTIARAFSPITMVVGAFDHVPIGGYGLGAGTNAARASSGVVGYTLGEGEWPRMINEGGAAAGLALLLIRQIFVVWLFLRCIAINRQTGDGSGVILMGFLMPVLVLGQITSGNQDLAFSWLTVGLCFGLLRHPMLAVHRNKRRSIR
ncbi:hypothetical protein [Pseudophaeobacter sp.]|uniref:hypothetical protein n=1 Tax=Pseudophaeobacter sp. TaxID=1971739 RepID=UPI00329839CF